MLAYSLCELMLVDGRIEEISDWSFATYSSILDTFRLSALECDTTTLVLETLRSDEALDLGGLGV